MGRAMTLSITCNGCSEKKDLSEILNSPEFIGFVREGVLDRDFTESIKLGLETLGTLAVQYLEGRDVIESLVTGRRQDRRAEYRFGVQ